MARSAIDGGRSFALGDRGGHKGWKDHVAVLGGRDRCADVVHASIISIGLPTFPIRKRDGLLVVEQKLLAVHNSPQKIFVGFAQFIRTLHQILQRNRLF